MKFLLEAKPRWLFIGFATLLLGALPFAASSAGVVTNDLAQGRPEAEVVTVQLAPKPHDHPSTPTPTPTPAPPSSITIEPPTIVVENAAPDLSPILAAIAALSDPIDVEALITAIETALADIEIIVRVDVGTITVTCDTRGQTCEVPPFGQP